MTGKNHTKVEAKIVKVVEPKGFLSESDSAAGCTESTAAEMLQRPDLMEKESDRGWGFPVSGRFLVATRCSDHGGLTDRSRAASILVRAKLEIDMVMKVAFSGSGSRVGRTLPAKTSFWPWVQDSTEGSEHGGTYLNTDESI
ncbi:hypothetical protein OROMI_017035 [Orobanche minor]